MELFAQDDLAECHALLARGSKSFAAAGKLLPARARDAAAVLYAFCRVADDAVDDSDEADRVERLRVRLNRVYSGRGLEGPVERCFARVVERFDLPIEVMEALIEGFEWDAAGRRYPDLRATLAYSARVASAVGVAMTAILADREPHLLARACDLGLAMQLTNIARDVGEDARRGRLYLPEDWLRAEGVDPDAFLRAPEPLAGVRRVVLQLLEVADGLYATADAGIAALPSDVRSAIYAARFIYADIGRVIREREGDSVTSRAVVSGARKLWLLGRAVASKWDAPGELLFAPPSVETEFLVEAFARPARAA
ncbi:MAG: phytoene/squalene synthase family protein [Polyangiaceae bacterium]